ncbi:hypothetical protein EDB84DRAFT_1575680 [Lactarius hengduanensis]|nr:hypothetical protein EDB84DRAFT_1575680 [Lactarius hengduanensis]
MSHDEVPHETINLEDRAERGIGDRAEQMSNQNQTLEESNFVDGSGPLFTIYTDMAEEHDKKQAERWPADTDGILIFGVDNLHLPRVAEALPILLHISLFLFFAGLLVFLFNIDHTAFSAIVLTIPPSHPRHGSSPPAPLLFQAPRWFTAFTCVSRSKWEYFGIRRKHYDKWFTHGLAKTAEEFARKLSPEIDGRALMWTLDRSDEDLELVRFFASIPGSKVLNDPIGTCIKPNMERMSEILIGLFHRTLTSNLVAPKIRKQRLAIRREAMSAASLPISSQIFHRVINAEWDGQLSSIEFGIFLGKTDRSDPVTAYHSQTILSIIRGTLPALQHDFCDLWNEIALLASGPDHRPRSIYIAVLRNVRGAYIADTNSAPTKSSSSTAAADDDHVLMLSSSYPLCNVSDHHLHLHHSISRLACYIAPSSAPQSVVVPSGCVPPITQINVNQFPGIVTPTSDSIPNGPAANTAIILSAPGSMLVAAVPHSVIPGIPPAFPVPVHDILKPSPMPQLPADPDPAASRSDHAPFGPDTDSSTPVTTPLAPPSRPTSTLDRGATTDGEETAKVALRNDKATGPPLVDPVTTTTTIPNSVRSPQPSPLRSPTEIAIASPLQPSRDAEQRGNQPPALPTWRVY